MIYDFVDTHVAPTIDDEAFAVRLGKFHRAVYASQPFVFDEVMRKFFEPSPGCVAHDHCLLHHQGQWHLFVLSNPLSQSEQLVQAVRRGDWEAARHAPYAVGDVHAVGEHLCQLQEVGKVLTPPQGDMGLFANTNSCVHRVGDRWINLFSAFGRDGQKLCAAWSNDLVNWEYDQANPLWRPPAWAGGTNVCKGPCIVEHEGRFFVFYNLNLSNGVNTVSLLSTRDFHAFEDHGPVLMFPTQLRGTQGCESPTAFVRNGIWHLMVTSGDQWWHAISNRPNRFMNAQSVQTSSASGVYDMGPFHVAKVVEHNGRWFMTSSYKAEHRRRCRTAGTPIFRGEHADESGLLAGLFISEIEWEGDRPILCQPAELP